MENARIWVIVPAYNEATVISGVVADVVRAGYQVVVIDDRSRDTTIAAATLAGATVVRHPINLGQGAALQTGIEFALAQGADVIVTFDADGQHRTSDIEALVEAQALDRADFVLGSRFLGHTTNLPALRRLTLLTAVVFSRMTTGLRLTDAHNGLRAMTRRGAAGIHLRQNRMAHASEILQQIAASGLRYVEVPVTIDYTPYSLAKGQKIGDAFTILFDLFARRLYR